MKKPQNSLQGLGPGSYSEFCEHGQAASWLELTCLPASNTCCLHSTLSCPHEARNKVFQCQHRYVHQPLQHRDKGCRYHLLKRAVMLSEITEISSKHLRPRCSGPDTAACGVSEGVKQGLNFRVARAWISF